MVVAVTSVVGGRKVEDWYVHVHTSTYALCV